ncbi:MAG: hypothetical protein ACREPI_01535 [Candidatus Dormibacterales bacterium]
MTNPDVSIVPDFTGLPRNVVTGLVHLTDNAAAVLMLVSALGIVISLIMLVFASWSENHHLGQRSRGGLALSVFSMALLYGGMTAANYAAGLFR